MNTGTAMRVTAMIKSAGLNRTQLAQLAQVTAAREKQARMLTDLARRGMGAVGGMFKRRPAGSPVGPGGFPRSMTIPRPTPPVAASSTPSVSAGLTPPVSASPPPVSAGLTTGPGGFPSSMTSPRAPTPMPSLSPPVAAARDGMSMGRRIALGGLGTGVVGGGLLGAGQLYNHLPSFRSTEAPEDAFSQNMAKWNEQSQALREQIAKETDPRKVSELSKQLEGGEFGGSRVDPFFGLRPFGYDMSISNPFGDRQAKIYQERALKAQGQLQKELDTARGNSGVQPGDDARIQAIEKQLASGRVLPAQAEALERERSLLRQRMESGAGGESPEEAAIIKRMQASGMRIAPGKPRPVTPHAYGSWQVGQRPGSGHAQGFGKTPFQAPKKPFDPWEDVIPRENNNLMFG